jgi:imidazoleglycerol-phosphate dehydratase
MVSANEILRQVVRIQEKNGFSDVAMSKKIGCSRPLYQRTRTGKIRVGGTFLRGAMQLIASATGEVRKAMIKRKTRETNIELELNIDGKGIYEINTGITVFDHLLAQLARHGLFDIKLKATGDDTHHLVEDVAICLGKAFQEALGEKEGIVRMADVAIPMDESLVMLAVDISGRGYAVLDLPFGGSEMSGLATDLVRHFLESFAVEARMNLHARVAYGSNDHHKAEALFKALGRALDTATRIDPRIEGALPSTKGYLEK